MNAVTEGLQARLECPLVMRFSSWFVTSVAAILSITGIAKLWSAFGSTKLLSVADPIFGIEFGKLMLVVGVSEIVISLACILSKRQTLALGVVAWMSTMFLVYRLGLWWIDRNPLCSCLGNLTDAIHISPQAADNVMKVVLAYLLAGSYGLLIWQWRRGRRSPGSGIDTSPSIPLPVRGGEGS